MTKKLFIALSSGLFAVNAYAKDPVPANQTVINCEYHVSANTSTINETIVSKWAENATLQSFDYNYTNIDSQLNRLKSCYTEQGWKSFQDALNASGNIKAIQSQQLSVSSSIEEKLTITPTKERSQWKVTVPLRVVYQNDKIRLTQLLTADVLIGRKINGDLGIMQLIAVPRQPTHSESKH